MGMAVWLASQQHLPQKGSHKHVNVPDNRRQFQCQRSSTDSDAANPLFPWLLSYMELRREKILTNGGWTWDLSCAREGWMRIRHCGVEDVLGWGNDGDT